MRKRIISLFTATLKRVGRLVLTHDASDVVVFGEHGQVVLTWDQIYLYQYDGVGFNDVRKTPRPDGIWDDCCKAVSDTTIFLQDGDDAPTLQLDIKDLQHIGELDHEGRLRGMLYPDTLVYRQRKNNEDWNIVLHQPGGDVILQPRGHNWDWGLSLCKTGEYTIVVEHCTQAMDVFSTSGNFLLLFCHT